MWGFVWGESKKPPNSWRFFGKFDWFALYQTKFHCSFDGSPSAVDIQLAEDVPCMLFHRTKRDHKFVRDLLIGITGRQNSEDFQFAGC